MISADVQAKIKQYEALMEKAKTEVIKAETQLSTLKQQREGLLEKLSAYELTEDTLWSRIESLTKEIESEIVTLDEWAEEVKAVLG